LGIDVIEIARVEENTEYYNMKFASGIAGVSQGKFIDCYFDITVKNTVKHGIWLGGITSGTAQNGQPALKMENCIINTYFDEGFSSENVMYYGAVAGSADIPTNYKETVKNCYVVSNKNTRYGRVEGAVENKTYATKDALARSIGNFGLTGEYWSIVSGEVPVLEHMGELYSAFPTKVDSESLGDVYKESTDDSVTFDTSFVSGDIVKVKIDDKETAFTDNGGTVTVDRSVFDDLSGVVSVKIYTDSTMYLSSATAIDFVIDDADEFWYDFVAYAAGDEEGQALFANAYIVLATNIDCENQMIGDRGLFDKVEFNGTFDGRGYSIYNAVTDTGVFCLIGKGGIVKNLGLMNVQVTSYIESPILGGAYLASGIVCDGQGQFFDCYFDVHLTAPLADGGAVLYLGGITTERYRIINMSTGQHGYLRMENCIVKVAVDQEILDSYVAWKGAIMPQNLGGASCAGYATDCYFVSDINKFYSMYNGLPKHTYGGSKQDNSVYADFDALLADYPHIVFAGEYWVCAQGEVPKLVHAE
ncbi:MAG: hypothetical protein J5697_01440, partial [Clostridia bacterium]|nr:hypothetical protein [Clostridia bacterium]